MTPPPLLRPEALAQAGPYPAVSGELDRALALVRYLRAHCPWDRKQTAESLIPHLLEETHETVAAIREGDADGLEGELGDLLLNLAFQIVVLEEGSTRGAEQIVSRLENKMVLRHPHLFGLGEREPWEVLKAREREARKREARDREARDREALERESEPDTASEAQPAPDGVPKGAPEGVLSGLPASLDPLLRAYRLQQKAAGVGFDWDDARGALAKVREELAEVEEALEAVGDPSAAARDALEDEIGDLLFSVVNVARLVGVHPVPALDRAGKKFQRRFEGVEALARAQGVPIPGASLDALDVLWDAVKAQEKAQEKAQRMAHETADETAPEHETGQ